MNHHPYEYLIELDHGDGWLSRTVVFHNGSGTTRYVHPCRKVKYQYASDGARMTLWLADNLETACIIRRARRRHFCGPVEGWTHPNAHLLAPLFA